MEQVVALAAIDCLGLLTVAYYFGVFAMAWDLLFGFAHRRQVFVDLDSIGAAHLAAQLVRLGQGVIEDAPLQFARLAAEEAVKGEGWKQLDRDWRIRRAP